MANQVNVIIMVDSIKALVNQSLEGNCFLVDDSFYGSVNKGSLNLNTRCALGQTIHWTAKAIDVQTPINIKEISFETHPFDFSKVHTENLDTLVWNGKVPFVKQQVTYNYKIILQIGKGKKSELEISSPALTILPFGGY
ncbi:MAG: hypothetical protein ACI8QQ_003045 [Psychroserpens sp.]|jgi:hypothetical protein